MPRYFKHDEGMNDGWARVADAIKRRRHMLGLTQDELAALAPGLSRATVQVIERGERANFRERTLRSLERALGWHVLAIEALLDDQVEATDDSRLVDRSILPVTGTLHWPASEVELALAADMSISDDTREALLVLYRNAQTTTRPSPEPEPEGP